MAAKKTTKTEVSMEKLLEFGAHFGHQVRRWNPKMEDYLYGAREGVHIFDLAKTKDAIEAALEVVEQAAKNGKQILWVGTKKQVKDDLKKFAQEHSYPYVVERWLGGTLTNFKQMRGSVKVMQEMEENLEKGEYKHLTKKEILMKQREQEKLERKFGGLRKLESKPDLMVIFDVKREAGAVSEAEKEGIETIGIVDSNGDPTSVNWPIPMNDDASQAVEYLLKLFEEALERGRKNTKKKEKNNKKEESGKQKNADKKKGSKK